MSLALHVTKLDVISIYFMKHLIKYSWLFFSYKAVETKIVGC